MPVQPSGGTGPVPNGTDGCPDTSCPLYLPGNYSSGITIAKGTSIFDPGVYYVNGGITLGSLSNVFPSAKTFTTAPYGTVFFLTGCTLHCMKVAANSGSGVENPAFSVANLACPGGPAYATPPVAGVSPPTTGNILLAPCTGPYGDPSGLYRGILFYIDHAAAGATASWGGNGTFTLAGAFYAHSSSYDDVFTMVGTPGSNSLVIGNIIVDTVSLGGNSGINMQLNPNSSYPILEVELLE
jgi:hypothetical protein